MELISFLLEFLTQRRRVRREVFCSKGQPLWHSSSDTEVFVFPSMRSDPMEEHNVQFFVLGHNDNGNVKATKRCILSLQFACLAKNSQICHLDLYSHINFTGLNKFCNNFSSYTLPHR